MHRLVSYARGLFPVRRGERGLALFLFVLMATMVLSDWVGKIGADSLFVKRFGVQHIPEMYVATPLALLATSAAVFALVGRVRRRTLLFAFNAAVTVTALAIQLAIPLGGLVFPVAYVFAHGVKETIYLLFWIYAGNLYDGDQAKRLFPLFAGATLVGKILGGVVAVPLAETAHTENFIGAQAVGSLLCLVLIAAYWSRLPEGAASPNTAERRSGPRGIRGAIAGYGAVSADPLLRTFGVGIFFWYFLMQIGSYLYLVGLDAASAGGGRASEDLFSLLYAGVYTSSTLVALGLQVFVAGGLIRRVGIAWSLLVFPVWYVLSYGGALIEFSLVVAVAIQLGERVVVPALHRPASELVYSHVPEPIRPRARAFLSGGVNAIGNMAAAALLIGMGALGLGATAVLALATASSLAFVGSGLALRRALSRRIDEDLRSDEPRGRREALLLASRDGAAVGTAAHEGAPS